MKASKLSDKAKAALVWLSSSIQTQELPCGEARKSIIRYFGEDIDKELSEYFESSEK